MTAMRSAPLRWRRCTRRCGGALSCSTGRQATCCALRMSAACTGARPSLETGVSPAASQPCSCLPLGSGPAPQCAPSLCQCFRGTFMRRLTPGIRPNARCQYCAFEKRCDRTVEEGRKCVRLSKVRLVAKSCEGESSLPAFICSWIAKTLTVSSLSLLFCYG